VVIQAGRDARASGPQPTGAQRGPPVQAPPVERVRAQPDGVPLERLDVEPQQSAWPKQGSRRQTA